MTSSTNELLDEIPTYWYLDKDIYNLEQKNIFATSAHYTGHVLMVPQLNDYHVLENKSDILFHNERGIELISNICRHRQGLMLSGRGNTTRIICPLHHWSYNNKGTLLKTPDFPYKVCRDLPVKKLQQWNGLLFSGATDVSTLLADLSCRSDLDFSDYVYTNSMVKHHNFNWKIFIDNYLDDYHVRPFHPGLRSLVDCDNISWEFGEHYSVQKLGLNKKPLPSHSINHNDWYQALLAYLNGRIPEYGAIWFLLYPSVMIEHLPEMLTVSVVKPNGPEHCINEVDFFYPKKIVESYPDIVRLSQLAYEETAGEDDEICSRIFNGRKALVQQNRIDLGPFEPVSEKGIPYFHDYLMKAFKITRNNRDEGRLKRFSKI